jgi:hypothetical protein
MYLAARFDSCLSSAEWALPTKVRTKTVAAGIFFSCVILAFFSVSSYYKLGKNLHDKYAQTLIAVATA